MYLIVLHVLRIISDVEIGETKFQYVPIRDFNGKCMYGLVANLGDENISSHPYDCDDGYNMMWKFLVFINDIHYESSRGD